MEWVGGGGGDGGGPGGTDRTEGYLSALHQSSIRGEESAQCRPDVHLSPSGRYVIV